MIEFSNDVAVEFELEELLVLIWDKPRYVHFNELIDLDM